MGAVRTDFVDMRERMYSVGGATKALTISLEILTSRPDPNEQKKFKQWIVNKSSGSNDLLDD